ncbi:MAG: helix-turn-helix domain-containing protein [Elusimicrobia bacterium]|nr:helix-turn-helix domain-containing protein [Elusimicrobiota bacterium]
MTNEDLTPSPVRGRWLSTGQAAKLCGVKPDTIRKWIQKGRLKTQDTMGGHHRVLRDDLVKHIPLPAAGGNVLTAQPENPGLPMRCWEYLSERGQVRDKCKDCVVYKIRAARCYAVADLDCDIGHARQFCGQFQAEDGRPLVQGQNQTCQECLYFRRIKGLATNVLVITPDKDFVSSLETEKDEATAFRFAGNSYEASAVISGFRPAFVVIDSDLNEAESRNLVKSLADDPRIAGVKIIQAVSIGTKEMRREEPGARQFDGVIEKPFNKRQFAALIENFPVENYFGSSS